MGRTLIGNAWLKYSALKRLSLVKCFDITTPTKISHRPLNLESIPCIFIIIFCIVRTILGRLENSPFWQIHQRNPLILQALYS